MKSLILISLFLITSYAQAADPVLNFFKVEDGVYRGARPTSDQAINQLANNYGIRNIINLQGGDYFTIYRPVIAYLEPGELPSAIEHEKSVSIADGMGYFHAQLSAVNDINSEENKLIDDTLEFMHEKNNQPVFIHCEHGKDRTGLIIALYKVKYNHVNIEVARQEWIAKGHTKSAQIFTGDLDDYYYKKVKEFNR
jgi:protein tyrosine/serine phosphatase